MSNVVYLVGDEADREQIARCKALDENALRELSTGELFAELALCVRVPFDIGELVAETVEMREDKEWPGAKALEAKVLAWERVSDAYEELEARVVVEIDRRFPYVRPPTET